MDFGEAVKLLHRGYLYLYAIAPVAASSAILLLVTSLPAQAQGEQAFLEALMAFAPLLALLIISFTLGAFLDIAYILSSNKVGYSSAGLPRAVLYAWRIASPCPT